MGTKSQHFHFLLATLRKLHPLSDPWISHEPDGDLDPLPYGCTRAEWLPEALGLQRPRAQPWPSSCVRFLLARHTLTAPASLFIPPIGSSPAYSLPACCSCCLGSPGPRSSQAGQRLVTWTSDLMSFPPKTFLDILAKAVPSIPSHHPGYCLHSTLPGHHAAWCAPDSPSLGLPFWCN